MTISSDPITLYTSFLNKLLLQAKGDCMGKPQRNMGDSHIRAAGTKSHPRGCNQAEKCNEGCQAAPLLFEGAQTLWGTIWATVGVGNNKMQMILIYATTTRLVIDIESGAYMTCFQDAVRWWRGRGRKRTTSEVQGQSWLRGHGTQRRETEVLEPNLEQKWHGKL